MALRAVLIAVCVSMLVAGLANAQPAAPLRGRSVQSVIDELRAAGAPLVYSTSLVTPALTVESEPTDTAPLAVARAILAPHGLEIREEGGVWLVVRGSAPQPAPPAQPGRVLVSAEAAFAGSVIGEISVELDPPAGPLVASVAGRVELTGLAPGRHSLIVRAAGFLPERVSVEVPAGGTAELAVTLVEAVPKLDELVVSASRYDVSSDVQPSATYFSRDEIESLASLGDDTVRVAHQLPGVATNEFSARPYVRGGAANELAVMLDGIRLVEPYHLRDFQGVFSAVDQRIVDSVAVHAGGFPAEYGDALSGLMVIEPRRPTELAHEVGLSALYTSVLSSGTFADGAGSWLAAGRSSNLERVVADERGQPAYSDLFVRMTAELGERHELVFGSLGFRDDVFLTLEDDPDDLEQGASDTSSRQTWLRLDSNWTDEWSSSLTLYGAEFDSARRESVADLGELVGTVDDRRGLDVTGFESRWRFEPSERQRLAFGIVAEQRAADYEYASAGERRGLLATLGAGPLAPRALALTASGDTYGAFVEDRVRITERLIADLGLRWDRQTYLPPGADSQFSPRASLLYRLGAKTDLRLSHGRFFQPEGLLELQIEDGVTAFAPAQRAAHTIVSLERRLGGTLAVRAEAYRKWTRNVRSRFENAFDPLVLLPELRASRILLAPERAEARGVEVLVSGAEPVAWWAGFSFAHADDVIDGVLVPRSWDQHGALTAGVTWPVGQWSLSFTGTLHRGWPVTDVSVVTAPTGERTAVLGPRNARRLGDVHRLDARASREFGIGPGALRFFAELTNLTNRENPCCLIYEPVTLASGQAALVAREHARVRLAGNLGLLWQF